LSQGNRPIESALGDVTALDMSESNAPVVARLAPSPTGDLHLGHARSFLLAWWSCRRKHGRLLLRFEDLDSERAGQHWVSRTQEDLEWLGLDWDDCRLQSRGLPRITQAAMDLLAQGFAYPCVCSRGDIRSAASAPHGPTTLDVYPGTCRNKYRDLSDAEHRTGKQAGLRAVVSSRPVGLVDAVRGAYVERLDQTCGDFLILRRDKIPAYQLAVVVDDAADGVTEVVRGDDLLQSTPRQLWLFETLGLNPPAYYHVPLILNEAGKRLAKRDAAMSLRELRQLGVDPRAVVAWAARCSGISTPPRITAADALPQFDWSQLPPHPVRVTRSTLDDLLGIQT
jgi:glutamyl-tRNA synthetase